MIGIFKSRLLKGVVTRKINKSISGIDASVLKEINAVGEQLKLLISRRFKRSFYIREVDTGSCGACESEIISTTNPIYDIQRFGINFVASPRHADALLVTGPVSRNMFLALKKTYDAMPEPKFVITVGDCALDGGIFKDLYYTHSGVDKVVPVILHISGCPPKPMDIIKSLLKLLQRY